LINEERKTIQNILNIIKKTTRIPVRRKIYLKAMVAHKKGATIYLNNIKQTNAGPAQ